MPDIKTMTDEQKKAAFEKWASRFEARQANSKKRRAAVKALIAAHQVEYDKLLKTVVI